MPTANYVSITGRITTPSKVVVDENIVRTSTGICPLLISFLDSWDNTQREDLALQADPLPPPASFGGPGVFSSKRFIPCTIDTSGAHR
jgi:hypothetical protein